ncbi:MAG: hypothetical protein ACI86H_001211 [bacterium]|jgi:hypothetical protein
MEVGEIIKPVGIKKALSAMKQKELFNHQIL